MISLSEIHFLLHVDEKYSRPRKYQYNEDDFQFQFHDFCHAFISMVTQKHGNKEKLSINSFSLFNFKLVIWKKLVRN